MRSTIFFIFLILVYSGPAYAQSAYDRILSSGKIRCGYVPWTSFFETDLQTGELKGLYKDISDTIFNLLNLDVEYVEIVLGQNVQDLNSGKVDAICGDGPWVISTAKYIDFSDPYLYFPIHIFVRTDESRFSDTKALNSNAVSFIGIDGDLSTALVPLKYPKAQVNSLATTAAAGQMFLDLVGKKADAVITDPMTANHFMINNPGQIKILNETPLAVYPGGFSVKKGETALMETLNAGVQSALDLGLIDDLLNENGFSDKQLKRIAKPYR